MDCTPVKPVRIDPQTLPANPIHLLCGIKDDDGLSLDPLVEAGALVVFLRHNGCTFTREILADLKKYLPLIQEQKLHVIIVHMGNAERGQMLRRIFDLKGTRTLSDHNRLLYTAFGLAEGKAWQVYGPKVIWRALADGLLWRHGVGKVEGAIDQLAGAFVVRGLEILQECRPSHAAEPIAWGELLTTH